MQRGSDGPAKQPLGKGQGPNSPLIGTGSWAEMQRIGQGWMVGEQPPPVLGHSCAPGASWLLCISMLHRSVSHGPRAGASFWTVCASLWRAGPCWHKGTRGSGRAGYLFGPLLIQSRNPRFLHGPFPVGDMGNAPFHELFVPY